MEQQILAAGRSPRMRTTLYGEVPAERRRAALRAAPLGAVRGADAGKLQRSKRLPTPVTEPIRLDWPEPVRAESALYEKVVLMAACN